MEVNPDIYKPQQKHQAFLMEIVYNYFLILMISKDLKFKRMVDQNHNDAT